MNAPSIYENSGAIYTPSHRLYVCVMINPGKETINVFIWFSEMVKGNWPGIKAAAISTFLQSKKFQAESGQIRKMRSISNLACM